MARTALPKKASDLIEVALADLAKVERNKAYKIDMGTWHEPIGCTYVKDDDGYDTDVVIKPANACAVCFGGAVISQTLKSKFNQDLCPESFDTETANKLNALDSFRVGDVAHGLYTFYNGDEVFSTKMNRKIIAYSTRNSAKFKKQMRQLAKDLKAFGM